MILGAQQSGPLPCSLLHQNCRAWISGFQGSPRSLPLDGLFCWKTKHWACWEQCAQHFQLYSQSIEDCWLLLPLPQKRQLKHLYTVNITQVKSRSVFYNKPSYCSSVLLICWIVCDCFIKGWNLMWILILIVDMQSSSLKLYPSFEQKAMLLKRQAFAVFSGEIDQYHLYLPLIQGEC